MTSDAKIGLLLGLVFIFIIAFIINGLPHFNKNKDNNELTTEMVNMQDNLEGVASKERAAINPDVRYNAPLPSASVEMEESEGVQPTTQLSAASATLPGSGTKPPQADAGQSSPEQVAQGLNPSAEPAPASEQTNEVAEESVAAATPSVAAMPPQSQTPAAQQAPLAKNVYVVTEGDSISKIALKVYGSQEGKKLSNINGIYEANKKTMKSVNDLSIGQKLVIPAVKNVSPTAALEKTQMFQKVESIGAKVTKNESSQKQAIKQTAAKKETTSSSNKYFVKEGDNLWKIASTKLGNGNRYKEILKLNSKTMKSEDDLKVGMALVLPAK